MSQTTTETTNFNLSDIPDIQGLLQPLASIHPKVDEIKIRRLYLQASQQQWFAPRKLNYDSTIDLSAEERRVWIKLMRIFYTLEKMGLNVISNMMGKATRKLRSEEVSLYLSAQCFDEARHVFAIENYMRKLGEPPKYEYKYHVLGQLSSMGFFQVENWLFSTLFSENFASVFLRKAKTAKLDPLGVEMCKYLMVDESRHLHFLHIVLPDIMDRLSLLGRGYVKMSQFFIMKLTESFARTLDKDANLVGINRRDLLEEVFENVERAYESFGVTKQFLYFPKIASAH